ncbi:sortase [Candidatus Daviesbacteria bacterium]|nr:sortase [Candidatus Daviesbacteria bacterium]
MAQMFGSSHLKKIFLIRFVAYLAIFVSVFTIILAIEPIVGEEINYRLSQMLGLKHSLPKVVTSSGQVASPQPSSQPQTGFGNLVTGTPDMIVPASTDYGIVIEKINANAKVMPGIDPGNEAQYTSALAKGVAEAKGSTLPGQPGNLYIFSHSTDAPWNIVRFNAIFYLLRELDKGDRVVIFYQGRRYDYIVFDKTVADPADTSYLNNRYDKPVLTLQTCDPPGTLLRRLLVRAVLEGS